MHGKHAHMLKNILLFIKKIEMLFAYYTYFILNVIVILTCLSVFLKVI